MRNKFERRNGRILSLVNPLKMIKNEEKLKFL